MDLCLLCLKSKSNFEHVVSVGSKKWTTYKMESLVEQHLWSMSIIPNDWICLPCWNIVNDFHNFYMNVKDAHSSLSAIVKTEIIDDSATEEYENIIATTQNRQNKHQDESPTSIEEDNLSHNPIVKLEIEEPVIDEEAKISLDNICLMKSDPLAKESEFNEKILNSQDSEEVENVNSDSNEDEHKQLSSSIVNDTNHIDLQCKLETANGNDTQHAKPHCRFSKKDKNYDEFVASNLQLDCGICQMKQETFYGLLRHSELEHKQQGFVICCKRKFFNRFTLVEHINWHLDPEYFKCNECGKVMSDRRCLKQHAKVHVNTEKTHFCDECGKAFAGANLLQRHKLTHLPEEEKKFSCKECSKNFGDKYLLSYHIRVVHLNKRVLVCAICGQSMRSKETFDRHMRLHEGLNAPTLACDVCGLKMTTVRTLKRHKEAQHPEGGRVEYKCEVCAKISPTLKAHRKHVKYQHEMGADYKCTICDKAYKRSTSLKEHMATHTGTALYTCPHCPKTFNSNGNMHNHRKKCHPVEWEEACRAKYSGNLPPMFNPPFGTVVQPDIFHIQDIS